jgi:hypothetical protein
MKKLLIGIFALGSLSSFSAEVKLNVSAQNATTCLKSVKLLAELIVGQGNRSIEVKAKRLERGYCDGSTCNPNSQKFEISFDDNRTFRTMNVSSSGPDSSGRCELIKH